MVQRKTGHRMKLRRTRGLITVINAVTATCEKQLRESAREQGLEPETIVFNSLGLPYTIPWMIESQKKCARRSKALTWRSATAFSPYSDRIRSRGRLRAYDLGD